MIEKPLVSILTPTWNRSGYLERVWGGLTNQTYKNIEWLVADDGSSDDTIHIVNELASRSSFPVTLIKASAHVGKTRMDNEAIRLARGDFILWNDSDDYLLPEAVQRLMDAWYSIPESDRDSYVGVTALCANENGVISTPLPCLGVFDTTWNDLAEIHKVTGDMMNMTRATAIKEFPFPEVDLLIPEGVTWTTLGSRKVRILPEVVQIKEYGAPHCISFDGKMKYSRGRAYAMATSERNLRSYKRPLKLRIWKLITYIRYCRHGEIGLSQAVKLWGENSRLSSFILMLPIGWALALKDQLQGKVSKTHIEFMAAKRQVSISVNRFD